MIPERLEVTLQIVGLGWCCPFSRMHGAMPVWIDGSGPADHFNTIVLLLSQLDGCRAEILPKLLLVPSSYNDGAYIRTILDPGQRDLSDRCVMLQSHLLQHLVHTMESRFVHYPRLRPSFGSLPCAGRRHPPTFKLAGQQTLPKRAPYHRTDSKLMTGWQQFVFRLSSFCGVVDLLRDRRQKFTLACSQNGLREGPATIVRHAPIANLACLHEAGHCLNRLLDRRDTVPQVDKVKIYVVRAQTFQRFLNLIDQMDAGGSAIVRTFARRETGLGEEQDSAALSCKNFTENALCIAT